ncbi:hypothetical protein [Anaerospora hongkongensis]|uniref:hypothetical protein n=1 Tax=Anaerospora hongkongensis TaxID=244830 RepID=UPI00289E5646|nr:hypothetical protein [Anaerospora hongkongensis]
MKAKKVVAMLLAGATLTMTTAAFAEVKFSGDVSVKYQKDTADGQDDASANISTLKVLSEADLGSNWSFYTRLGGQRVSDSNIEGDFNPNAYSEGKRSVLAIDQFGFTHAGKDFNYKIGRQDLTIGQTALLYSRSDSNIGKHNFVDGITANGKSGIVDLSLVAVQEDNPGDEADNRVYALRAGYSPSERLSYGVTLGRYQDRNDGGESTNHWAVDSTYTLGKSSLTAEYTKSNSDSENKAYAAALGYDFDGKNAVSLTYFRVEDSGSMGGQSDFDAGNRGIHYGVTHQFDATTGLELVYKDQKEITSKSKNTSFEATVTYSF